MADALLAQTRRMLKQAAAWEQSGAPDPAPWAADEQGGAACCLECRREIAKSQLEISGPTLPADRFCQWCARPRA